jgi:hypothetical protein
VGQRRKYQRKVEFEEIKDHRQRPMKQTLLSDFLIQASKRCKVNLESDRWDIHVTHQPL